MNKVELTKRISDELGTTNGSAAKIVDAFVDAVTGELKQGGEVRIAGFGTFSVAEHAARKARNPQTGDPVEIPARKVPRFKAGAKLKQAVS